MILDTNLIIYHIKNAVPIPSEAIVPTVVAGELKSLVAQWKWGAGKQSFIDTIIKSYPLIDVSPSLINIYADIDIYSYGKNPAKPLPKGQSAVTMGKNDLWIAAIAFALNETLETMDKDFDHLKAYGIKLIRRDVAGPYTLPPMIS